MNKPFEIKVGARSVPYSFLFLQPDGTPYDLTNTMVSCTMTNKDTGVKKIDDTNCITVGADTDGRADYEWTTNDVNTAGVYYIQGKGTKDGKVFYTELALVIIRAPL